MGMKKYLQKLGYLGKVKDQIDGEHGWKWDKGIYSDKEFRVNCLVGAMQNVEENSKAQRNVGNSLYIKTKIGNEIKTTLADIIAEQYSDRVKPLIMLEEINGFRDDEAIIIHFNDHEKTKLKDIIRVIEKTEAKFWEEV